MRLESIISLDELNEAGIAPKAWLKTQDPNAVKVTTTPPQNAKVNPTGNYSTTITQPANPNGINPVNWLKPQNPNAVKINQPSGQTNQAAPAQTTPPAGQTNQAAPAQTTPPAGQTNQAEPTSNINMTYQGKAVNPNDATKLDPNAPQVNVPAGQTNQAAPTQTTPPAGQTNQAAPTQTTPPAGQGAGLNMPKGGIVSKALGKLATGVGKAVGGVQGAAKGAQLAYNRGQAASSAAATRNVAQAGGMSAGPVRSALNTPKNAPTPGGTTPTSRGSAGQRTGGGKSTAPPARTPTSNATRPATKSPFPNLSGKDFDSTHNVPITSSGASKWNTAKEKANTDARWFVDREASASQAGYKPNRTGVWQAPQQPTAESLEDIIRLTKRLIR